MINTKDLQIKSLKAFMRNMGYEANVYISWGFEYNKKMVKFKKKPIPNYVSFEDACKLHNSKTVRLSESFDLKSSLDLKGDFTKGDHLLEVIFLIAQQNKIVERVKLQKDHSEEFGIKCQNHKVEFSKYIEF